MTASLETLLHKLYSSSLLDGGLSGILSDLAQVYPDLPLSYQAQCVYRNTLYEGAILNHGPDAVEHLSLAQSFNPFPPLALKSPMTKVSVTSQYIRPKDVEQTDFYDEFLRPHGDINRAFGIILHRQGEDSAFVAANLPRRMKQREEDHVLRLFETLRPHFQGAFRLLMEVKQREIQVQAGGFWLEQIPTAAFAVTPDCKILHMNSHGSCATGKGRRLQIDRSIRLCAANRSVQRLLEASVRKAHHTQLPVGPVSLTGQKETGPLLFVLPIKFQDQVHPSLAPFLSHSMPLLVTVFDPADTPRPSTEVLRMAFGITEGESRLLQELISGRTLRESAGQLGISYHTARNQLASTTSKTGTCSQTEIVRLASQLLSRMSGPAVFDTFADSPSPESPKN